MCVVDKTLFSNAGTVLGVYETHWLAVLAMLNDYNERGERKEIESDDTRSNDAESSPIFRHQ